VKINELREEHGKIIQIHWDSVLYYIGILKFGEIINVLA